MSKDWQKLSDHELETALLRYADDIESEGRAYAPACMREAAARLTRGEDSARQEPDEHTLTVHHRVFTGEQLALILRRDWATRVLDASGHHVELYEGRLLIRTFDEVGAQNGYFPTQRSNNVEARLAAAEQLWPQLTESAKAKIGPKP